MSHEDVARLVRLAGRAIGRAGLAHAYGHVSARIDEESFLVCAAGPMGLIAPGDTGSVVPVRGPMPAGTLGEVRLHQQIYARRPDVGGVCRSQPPMTMALSAQRRVPQARHGFGTYFAPAPPLWPHVQLLRDDSAAAAVAELLGVGPAVVLRGNGAVTVAETLERAVVLAWYLEDAARVELEALRADAPADSVLTPEECRERATWSGGLAERMWWYLTAGDAEA